MEKIKGYDYSIEVDTGIEYYSEVVLVLTNYKSSVEDTVLYIKTIEGTNIIHVVSMIELDSLFQRWGCRIISKDETQIIRLDLSDFKSSVTSTIEKLWNDDIEYYLEIDRCSIFN